MDDEKGLTALLNEEMKRRNLGVRQTASVIGTSHPTVSRALAGDKISYEFAVQLSSFLHLPAEQVMRLAGLLPPVPAKTEQTEQLLYLFNQLPQNEKDRLIHHIEATLMILDREDW